MLTHPFIVEAAMDLFVPACVYNNTKDDADAKVLKSFGERAWNNPVVRFLDADRKDLIAKVHKDWSVARLASAMVAARKAAKKDVPRYLELLAEEAASRKRGVESAAFAMT